jgi:hypothetical protein
MKKYSKFYTYIVYLLIFFMSLPMAFAKKNIEPTPVDSMTTQQDVVNAYVQAGNEALDKLIAQNAINDQNGESEKNNYIFGFDNLPQSYTLLVPDIFATKYSTSTYGKTNYGDLTTLNANLRLLNQDLLAQGKSLIYIGINATLGVTLKSIAVKQIGTEATYSDLENATEKFKEKGYDFSAVSTVFNEIFNKIARYEGVTNVTTNPNGIQIIGIGNFLNFKMTDVPADIVSSVEELKKTTKGSVWTLCNFVGRGTTGAINWANDNTVRQIVYDGIAKYPSTIEPEGVETYLNQLSKSIQTTLLGTKTYNPKGLFYDDCYNTTGSYKSNLAADVTEEQVAKVNALVMEMMDNTLYTNYLKVGINAKTSTGAKITQADLINLEKALKDLKEACQNTYNAVSTGYVTKVIDFFKACSASAPNCEATKSSFIPQCFWNYSTTNPLTYQVAFDAGFVDGAISFVWDVTKLAGAGATAYFKLQEVGQCWVDPAYWLGIAPLQTQNCKEVRESSKQYFNLTWDLIQFVTPPAPGLLTPELENVFTGISAGTGKAWTAMKGDASTWWNEITETDNCGAYRQGKLVFDVASCFIGVGEINAAIKGGSKLAVTGGGILKYMTTFAAATGKIMAKTAITNAGKTAGFVFRKLQKGAVYTGLALQLAGFNAVELGGKTAVSQLPNLLTEVNAVSSKIISRGPSSIPYATIESAATTAETSIGKVVSELKDVTLEITENGAENIIKSLPKGDIKILQVDNLATKGEHFIVKQNNQIVATIKKEIGVGTATIIGLVIEYVTKPKDSPTDPDECKVCTARVPRVSDALCIKLKNLAAKSAYNGNGAVNRLCAGIASLTTLEAVVDRVLSFTQLEASAFLADINENNCTNNHLCGNISQIDVSIVNAWKYIVDAMNTGSKITAFAQDFPLINKVKEITTNTTKLNAFNNPTYSIKTLPEFLKVYGFADCYSCSIATGSYGDWMSKMDVILENSLDAQTKYLSRGGYAGFATREPFNNGANQWLRDGGQHMYRGMKTVLSLSGSRTLDFFTNPNLILAFDEPFGAANNPNYPKQKCDLRLGANTANVVFVEFKSYQEDTELSTKGVTQFLGYLSDARVNSLNDIVYVFNRKKINDAKAKAKMQTVLRNNAPKILSPIGQGGIGIAKVRQLFGNSITTVQDFIDAIDVISGNSIYNFVITN